MVDQILDHLWNHNHMGWSWMNCKAEAEAIAALLAAAGFGDLAAERKRIAVAVEADFEEWRTCGAEPITDFPLNSVAWWVKRVNEKAARIARTAPADDGNSE